MGKTDRRRKKTRHDPLHHQIEADQTLERGTKGKKVRNKGEARAEKRRQTEARNVAMSQTVSKKILLQARQQREEEEDEDERPRAQKQDLSEIPRAMVDMGDDDESSNEESEAEEDFGDFDIDEADEKAMAMFNDRAGSAPAERLSLADIVMAKLKEKEESMGLDEAGRREKEIASSLDPKVVEVYKGVARVLKTYTSGKVPKAFKIIPSLNNWEQILYLTNPHEWSCPAFFQATRLFASNLNPRMAQKFYNTVLLPKVRDDIEEHKKLNFHLYRSLVKSVYKPAAFFKGIILPLCEEDCSVREALIIASVLAKVSIQVLHSSVALLKLAQMPYSGPGTLFIKTLINKKYNLPYKVVDALVEFFLRFEDHPAPLPVLWHQCLLAFCQRYKEELTPQQKQKLKGLLVVHNHHQITDEVKRELSTSVCRGQSSNAMEE